MKPDDTILITGLREGDYGSYETLFQRYYVKFVNFVDCLIKDRDAAKDIVQEAFMKVYANREDLQEDLSIENYLYVIVKRLTLNFIRDHKKRVAPFVQEERQTMIPAWGGVEDIVIANESRARIQEAVSQMPAQRRKVWILSREQGLSNKEIAERLGLSVRTVDRHISLALQQIRGNLS